MMITREEAAAIADRLHKPWTSHRGEMAHVLRVDAERFRDLALSVVALHDEVERLRQRADEVLESASALEHYAIAGSDTLAHDHLLTKAIGERDAARAEVASLTASLRLAESSVSLLRADLATRDEILASERDLSAKLEIEIRRLRAADAPGTDDEAVAPWMPGHSVTATWIHPNGARVYRDTRFWYVYEEPGMYCHALDAMRAAVPGSV